APQSTSRAPRDGSTEPIGTRSSSTASVPAGSPAPSWHAPMNRYSPARSLSVAPRPRPLAGIERNPAGTEARSYGRTPSPQEIPSRLRAQDPHPSQGPASAESQDPGLRTQDPPPSPRLPSMPIGNRLIPSRDLQQRPFLSSTR